MTMESMDTVHATDSQGQVAAHQDTPQRPRFRFADHFLANIVRETVLDNQRPSDPPPDFQTPSRIRPQLYLSSAASEAYKPALEHSRITHVLQVGRELHVTHPESYTYHRLPVEDTAIEDIVSHFEDAFQFIDGAVATGGNVLVHCQAGISRSSAIVIGYLMWKNKEPYESTRSAVAAARYQINPNLGFKVQLLEFEKRGFTWEGWEAWNRDRLMASEFLSNEQKSNMYIAPKVYSDENQSR